MPKYYAILTFPKQESEEHPTRSIFKGKTTFAAINKAREWVVDNSESSRAEWEEKRGRVPDDDEWVKIMADCGFTITPAKPGVDF